jgi:hypothetical protein
MVGVLPQSPVRCSGHIENNEKEALHERRQKAMETEKQN